MAESRILRFFRGVWRHNSSNSTATNITTRSVGSLGTFIYRTSIRSRAGCTVGGDNSRNSSSDNDEQHQSIDHENIRTISLHTSRLVPLGDSARRIIVVGTAVVVLVLHPGAATGCTSRRSRLVVASSVALIVPTLRLVVTASISLVIPSLIPTLTVRTPSVCTPTLGTASVSPAVSPDRAAPRWEIPSTPPFRTTETPPRPSSPPTSLCTLPSA